MAQVEQVEQEGRGNTKPSPQSGKSRKWVFTLNNYTEEEYGTIGTALLPGQYVVGKEVGESGTPHLQGYVRYENPISFASMKKKLPRAHIQVARGSDDDNIKYCTKEGKYISTLPAPKLSLEEQYDNHMQKLYEGVVWKPWQADVLKVLENPCEPGDRKVHWFWESTGNTGKSFLSRYIEWKYATVLGNGKQADVFNGIKTFLEEKKEFPYVCLLDIPRTAEAYVNYGVLEKVKDGLVYSGKYEGGTLRLLPVHVVVFANFAPDMGSLSEDRWSVHNL